MADHSNPTLAMAQLADLSIKGPALVAPTRQDGWQNIITGLNDPLRDKRLGAAITAYRPSYGELAEMYRGSDTAGRIVERPAEEMTREWIEAVIGDDKDAAELVLEELKRLEAKTRFFDAIKLRRAFGGSGILMGVDDGQSMDQPLDEDRVRAVNWLTTLDCYELVPETWYTAPENPKYGMPEIFRLTPMLAGGPTLQPEKSELRFFAPIHESRVITFRGIITTRWQARETRGWGDSVLARVASVIRDFESGYDGAAALLQDFSQGVFKMHGLAAALAADADEKVMQRLRLMDQSRSILRSIVLDADKEDFSRIGTPMAGFADTLRELATRMAAAADMPVTVFMGISPAGLNATGASDIRLWYDRIRSKQVDEMEPKLRRLITLLFKAKKGAFGGREPKKWSIAFKPLYQLTEVEEASRRQTIASTDVQYINAGVLTPEEVAASRFGAGGYSAETVIDLEAREAMKRAREEKAEALQRELEKPETKPGEAPTEPGATGSAESESEAELNGEGKPAEGEPEESRVPQQPAKPDDQDVVRPAEQPEPPSEKPAPGKGPEKKPVPSEQS